MQKAEDIPVWDRGLRRLLWRGHVLREFTRRAPNQETILGALQEEGWPPRLDDPLPRGKDVDPFSRLRETVRALNRGLLQQALLFESEGTGEGVRWRCLDV